MLPFLHQFALFITLWLVPILFFLADAQYLHPQPLLLSAAPSPPQFDLFSSVEHLLFFGGGGGGIFSVPSQSPSGHVRSAVANSRVSCTEFVFLFFQCPWGSTPHPYSRCSTPLDGQAWVLWANPSGCWPTTLRLKFQKWTSITTRWTLSRTSARAESTGNTCSGLSRRTPTWFYLSCQHSITSPRWRRPKENLSDAFGACAFVGRLKLFASPVKTFVGVAAVGSPGCDAFYLPALQEN